MQRLFAVIFLVTAALAPKPAMADVLAHIVLSEQRLHLYVDGEKKHVWKISSGLHSGWTRTGTFRPYFLSRNHRSRLFGNAPMPFAVFYDSHWAVHGTTAVARLGRPASHGCVRLDPKNAAVLFDLVVKWGKDNTVIWITEKPLPGEPSEIKISQR
ncbi:MAG: L,D-transpeptidase [Pseudomonadota bacterium]|nr:L,D-transpeptidase [Pseudomonadota bacterium]